MYKTLAVLVALVVVIGFGFVGDARADFWSESATFYVVDDDDSNDDNLVELTISSLSSNDFQWSSDGGVTWNFVDMTLQSDLTYEGTAVITTGTGDGWEADWEQILLQVELPGDEPDPAPQPYLTFMGEGYNPLYSDDYDLYPSLRLGWVQDQQDLWYGGIAVASNNDDVAPVPIGSPLVLLGSGLIGFVSLMRVRRPDRKTA